VLLIAVPTASNNVYYIISTLLLFLKLSDFPCCLVPIHLWHVYVHEDALNVLCLLEYLVCLLTIFCFDYLELLIEIFFKTFKHWGENIDYYRVIINYHYFLGWVFLVKVVAAIAWFQFFFMDTLVLTNICWIRRIFSWSQQDLWGLRIFKRILLCWILDRVCSS
jgi:hypothetical protein